MLIDTHCHLHDNQWFTTEQQAEFLQSARQNNVQKIICIGTNHQDSLKARDFATQHENVYWTYGIHPEFAGEIDLASVADEAKKALEDGLPAAIGEIGLDYHYDGYDRGKQIKLFEQMLQIAHDFDLPVSLHLREAFADVWPVLDNFSGLQGVVHSFTGSKRDLRQALERNFYVGVNGLATYTTPALPPLENMLLETDAPFLTPVPYRGTINSPQHVRDIALYLSEKLGVAFETIVEQTTNNARRLFHI